MKSAKLFALTIFMVLGSFIIRAEGVGVFVFGADNAAIIAAPDSVRAWRTVASLPSDNSSLAGPDWHKNWYKKSGKGTLVTIATANQLGKVLLNANTYLHPQSSGSIKDCIPEPGVVLAFSKGNRTVELYVCFQCDIIIAYNPPTNGQTPHPETGGQIDFDPGHKKLLRMVKQIFPDDRQIQSL